MYIAIVALTMFFLPAASVLIERAVHPEAPIIFLVGRWFVFWGVGVRLGLAEMRQFFQPGFTAKEIFHMQSDEALPIVRELGIANVATGLVGLLALRFSTFILPVSIAAGVFYGVAGVRHMADRGRSTNETIAMVSDMFLFFVLAFFVVGSALSR
jgi:hypothetical protein